MLAMTPTRTHARAYTHRRGGGGDDCIEVVYRAATGKSLSTFS